MVIARPFPSQPARWPIDARKHYDKILQKADRIIEICNDPYVASKMKKPNEWVIDNSEAVIAIWNGQAGGTKNCIEYARARRKPVLVIDPVEWAERWVVG